MIVRAALTTVLLAGTVVPANASTPDPCSDVTLVFARGTNEAHGMGKVGTALAEGLRVRLVGKTFTTNGVDYPASTDLWASTMDGATQAMTFIRWSVQRCPNTRLVVGGFSQGAAVVGYGVGDEVPQGVDPDAVPSPLSEEETRNISAVVLFGTPSQHNLDFISAPPIVVGTSLRSRTLDTCIPEDPVCNFDGNGQWSAHESYVEHGTVDTAAEFTARQLSVHG